MTFASGGLTTMYRFGPFVVDSRRRTLLRSESPVPLSPKAFDVLLFLVQNPNRPVTKDELLQAVWGDRFVEEGNLTQYISHLRKALGDQGENPRLIVTIPRRATNSPRAWALPTKQTRHATFQCRPQTGCRTMRDRSTHLRHQNQFQGQ